MANWFVYYSLNQKQFFAGVSPENPQRYIIFPRILNGRLKSLLSVGHTDSVHVVALVCFEPSGVLFEQNLL